MCVQASVTRSEALRGKPAHSAPLNPPQVWGTFIDLAPPKLRMRDGEVSSPEERNLAGGLLETFQTPSEIELLTVI